MDEHSGCRDRIVRALARAAAEMGEEQPEVTISTAPPLVRSRWTVSYRCPHGIDYHLEPTGDQIAKWNAEVPSG